LKRVALILLFIFLFFGGISYGWAESSKTDITNLQGKFIIVIVDHLGIANLEDKELPNIKRLVEQGAVGLMNTNTAGSRTTENTYITIANGVRSLGSSNAGLSFNSNEFLQLTKDQEPVLSKILYTNTTGEKVHGKVVHVSVQAIAKANEDLLSTIKVGLLGETLKNNGQRVGIFGNADAFGPSRLAALLVMDTKGQVPNGIVNRSLLEKRGDFPFSIGTDFNILASEYNLQNENLDFIVVETGDLSRLESYRDYLSDEQYENLRLEALSKIDKFLGTIFGTLDFAKDRVMLLSPTPSRDAIEENNTATPVILAGKGISSGLLSSNSTRRQGIVANTDIAPTVLDFWEIEQPQEMVGRPLFTVKSEKNVTWLSNLNSQLVTNSEHRTIILRSFLILQIGYLVVSTFLILLIKEKKILRFFEKFAIVFLILPILILGYRLFRFESLLLTVPLFLLLAGLGYWLINKLNASFLFKLSLLSAVSSLGVIIDTLTGSNLVMNSPLGYDPLIGARYYGIGNEFTGILMGSTILALACLFEEMKTSKKVLIGLTSGYLVLVTYILYAPGLGADAGGLITAVIAFGYFILRLTGKQIRKKDVFLLLSGTLLLLILGATIDLMLNQSGGSHIGQAFRLLVQGDLEEITNMIARKLAVNIKLIMYSIWSKVLVATLVALGTLYYRPPGFMAYLKEKLPYLKMGFEATFVAAFVGFIVNDSGILQAITTFVYFIFPLVSLGFAKKIDQL